MTATLDPTTGMARLEAMLDLLEPEQVQEFVSRLPPEHVALLERVMARRTGIGWRADPLSMGMHFGKLTYMPHTALLSRKFVDAVRGRSSRQIWNVPARYGKTFIASKFGPVWALDDDPTIKLALTSYGDTLAQENSTTARDLILEHQDELRVRLRRDRRRNDRFVTPQDGGLLAAGVGSGITGFGFHGIVIDDPFKNWAEAHSETRRLHIWNWYRSTVRTRLEDRPDVPGFIIVVQTRWHEDDLTGKLLDADENDDGEKWELVRLPAIAEAPNPQASQAYLREPDPLGRAPGEPLAPLLFTLESVLARSKSLGSYLTAGMEQQRPAPEEGTDIKRAWWRFGDPPPRYDTTCTSWDMKLKDKESGDFVVGQAWGRTGSDYWCFDQLRGQWNLVTTKTAIVLLSVRHPEIGLHVIENTGNAPEVMTELRRPQRDYEISDEVRGLLGITGDELDRCNRIFRRGMTGLVPENVTDGSKRVRMRAQTPLIEAGNVHLPDTATWVPGFVDEMSAFPEGAHDDQVDACSQGLKRLRGGAASAHGPPKNRPTVQKPKASKRAMPRRPTSGVVVPRGRSGRR